MRNLIRPKALLGITFTLVLAVALLVRGPAALRPSRHEVPSLYRVQTTGSEDGAEPVDAASASKPGGLQERDPLDRTQAATASNEGTAHADTCAPIDLPPAVEDEQIEHLVLQAQCKQTWKQQDQIMGTWPSYAEARGDLESLLADRVDCNAPTEELLRAARQLRESFWQAGGDQSKTAYRYAYMARILLERAYGRDAQNLAVVNELVETIQSAHPLAVFSRRDGTERLVRNKEVEQTLLTLRSRQFEQIKTSVRRGSCPTWDDFVCAADLSILLNGRDNEVAQEVVEWQLAEAARGGWTGYVPFLDTFLSVLKEGQGVQLSDIRD